MQTPTLDLKPLLVGTLSGQGEVFGLSGRRKRGFDLAFFGEWTIGYDALHLDEVLVYDNGRQVRRHWAIQFDADGGLLGYDSHQAARMRGRALPDKIRVVFDRPLGLAQELAAPRVVIDVFEAPDGGLRLEGRLSLFGLVVQRTQASLRRGPA